MRDPVPLLLCRHGSHGVGGAGSHVVVAVLRELHLEVGVEDPLTAALAEVVQHAACPEHIVEVGELGLGAAMHKLRGNHQKHATHHVNEKSAQLRVQSMLLQLPIHNGPHTIHIV